MAQLSNDFLRGIDNKPTTLLGIPEGVDGVKATLKIMKQIVKQYKSHPQVRQLANDLTRHLSQKNYVGEALAIHDFVKNKIRYVRDVRSVETLQTPEAILKNGSGDCDDKSILSACLLESLGHPTRFIAVGFKPGSFSHVIAQTKIGNDWVTVECTEPVKMGWFPPNVKSTLIIYN